MNYNQYPQNSANFALDYIDEENDQMAESGGVRTSQELRRQGDGPAFVALGPADKNDQD